MKAPLSWLQEYVPIELSVDDLASRLALTGTEVERVSLMGISPEGDNLGRFVVGKVLDRQRHPDADKLSVCIVDVGEPEPRVIVCGAPNVASGQTVAVVLPGGTMPNGMQIRDAKLRGVKSSGMIMSEAELGLAAKSEGITELPGDWQAGTPLSTYFPLSDWVLEVEVTPNRPDCLSVRGMAREIAAITQAAFDEDLRYPYPSVERAASDDIAIEVLDPDLCPRYAARVIRGVHIADSPLWLKARIVQAGMRPVNNVVDVTNYVLWALGQPLHAFDLQTIRGGRIIVRRAYPGEKITTLDNEDRVLTADMLVIADAERASVIAGIMGGLDSEVTDETTDILLEGANFSGPSIMRTSGALGLRSEASTRYEKGLDPEMIPQALDMACKLFVEVCGGEVSAGTVDVRTPPRPQTVLSLRSSQVERVLGLAVPADETAGILARLGCQVEGGAKELTVTVPGFRRDLEREIDLVEEIARVHGLEQIPSTLPARRVGRGGLDRRQGAAAQHRRPPGGSRAGPGHHLQLRRREMGGPAAPSRRRRTPAGGDHLQPAERGPVADAPDAPSRSAGDGARQSSGARIRGAPLRSGPGLPPVVIAAATRADQDRRDPLGRRQAGLLAALRAARRLLPGQGLGGATGSRSRLPTPVHCRVGTVPPSGKSALLHTSGGRFVGWVGEVHPLVVQEYDLRSPVIVAAELDLDALLEASVSVPTFQDLLAYPVVEQDLALVVDAAVPASDLVAQLRAAGGDLLEDVAIFDVYEGAQVGEGKKSLALRLSFRAPDRTLNDAEVNELRASDPQQGRYRPGGAASGLTARPRSVAFYYIALYSYASQETARDERYGCDQGEHRRGDGLHGGSTHRHTGGAPRGPTTGAHHQVVRRAADRRGLSPPSREGDLLRVLPEGSGRFRRCLRLLPARRGPSGGGRVDRHRLPRDRPERRFQTPRPSGLPEVVRLRAFPSRPRGRGRLRIAGVAQGQGGIRAPGGQPRLLSHERDPGRLLPWPPTSTPRV